MRERLVWDRGKALSTAFFFFSSRRRHTRFDCDWSSDVCSSDLKTSLILAPVVAAGGLTVPMISGRGLGHTGGTLDKMEAIPRFNVNLSLREVRRVLRPCGLGLIGQNAGIAPPGKKNYAPRDGTSAVEDI